MITLRADGSPAAVRCSVALVDGKLWSSGTQDRIRTRHLSRDPRATVFVFERGGFGYLSIDARVTILEGPNAPEQSVRLFRVMQGRPGGPLSWYGGEKSEEEFLRTMIRCEVGWVFRQNVVAESPQLEIAHDALLHQADQVRRGRDPVARKDLFGHARAADQPSPFQHQDVPACPGEVAGRHQPVVSGADDDRVIHATRLRDYPGMHDRSRCLCESEARNARPVPRGRGRRLDLLRER